MMHSTKNNPEYSGLFFVERGGAVQRCITRGRPVVDTWLLPTFTWKESKTIIIHRMVSFEPYIAIWLGVVEHA